MSTKASDLRGFAVVVTRPAEQSETLCRRIEAAGGKAIRLPLLAIEPLGPECVGAKSLRNLDRVDWLIFVSTNAVRFGLNYLPEGLLHESQRPRIAAIGEATRVALERRGVAVDLAPKAQFNSESLLALPAFASMDGQRVVIVRGEGGRALLGEMLNARGARVEYAEVYRRVMLPVDTTLLSTARRFGALGAITVTSGEALDHLADQLGPSAMAELAATPLVVVSERLASQARCLGFECVVVADDASESALFEAVVSVVTTHTESTIHT